MSNGNKSLVNFRYLIGIIAATLAAIFIDEAFFHDDIKHKIYSIRQEFVKKEGQNAYNTFNAQYGTDSLQAIVSNHKQLYDASNVNIIKEAEGKSASGLMGVGTVTKLKISQAKEAKNNYNQKSLALDQLITKREKEVKEAESLANSNFSENGFLVRIKALYSLVFSDWAVFFVYVLFSLLVGAFEFMVIKFKLNTDETNYERRIKMIEKIGEERIKRLQNPDSLLMDPGYYLPDLEKARAALKNPPSMFN
jgi:hypothetical protein